MPKNRTEQESAHGQAAIRFLIIKHGGISYGIQRFAKTRKRGDPPDSSSDEKTLLDFDDPHEKECALRNCLKKVENPEIKNAEGEVIWSQKIACLDQEQEVETINPSLYRNAWLNHQTGLFKVVDGIFQVRGYDMSNLTVIAGETGWIVLRSADQL